MPWWAWMLLGGGLVLAIALGASWWFSRQFKDGLGALIDAAREVLDRSQAMVYAEVYGGPMVQGARFLRLQEQARAREDLMDAVKHTRFKLWKNLEAAWSALGAALTETQAAILRNEGEKTVESALARAYFSGFQLGLVFTMEGYWGPFVEQIALARPHKREEAGEKLAALDRFHPWVRPLVLDAAGKLTDEAIEMLASALADQAEGVDAAAWRAARRENMAAALEEACLHGVLHGMAQGQKSAALEKAGPPPSITNGHP